MVERAVILSTGDELTTGRVVDTNANYLANKLVEIGVEVAAVLTVGDVAERIAWGWERAMDRAELVISTGGIGPTADDLTTEVVARVAGRGLFFSEEVANHIRRIFASLNRPMPENNLKQARFPEGAVIIPNRLGTAPGYRIEVDTARGKRHLVVLPGVPREMKPMMEETVLLWLREVRGGGEVFLSRTFQTFGISESGLDELVGGAVSEGEGRLAFRASFPQISVRVTVKDRPQAVQERLETLSARIVSRIGPYVYAVGDVTMEEVVGGLLGQTGKTLSVADSLGGGLVSLRLTNVPGASSYFRGDVVAYSDRGKVSVLGLSEDTRRRSGAVSEESAREMAAGVRRLLDADIGLAVTGIAGPAGGTPDKPVGTAFLALAAEDATISRRYQLWGNREWVRTLAAQLALDWVRRYLLGIAVAESAFPRR